MGEVKFNQSEELIIEELEIKDEFFCVINSCVGNEYNCIIQTGYGMCPPVGSL